MQTNSEPSFFTLLLLISFASVNAVIFTPVLPEIAKFFMISDGQAQQTITWFLIGYAFGQLIYGPIANRFGRKRALYAGIGLQIISSFICIFAGVIHSYILLVIGRFLLALGSGVGLKMTFTLVNENFEPIIAAQKISYLLIAFAITPGLGVMLGGLLSHYFDWTSAFYASAAYGLTLLALTTQLPETKHQLDRNALQLNYLVSGYLFQFKNSQLISSGLLMGGATCFVYVFAALAPFLAINIMHMDSATYGIANILPSIGLVCGSIISAKMTNSFQRQDIVNAGIIIALIGSLLMLSLINLHPLFGLFVPMMFCYFGLSLIFANASTSVMGKAKDKAQASAVLNFINMGFATVTVLSVSMVKVMPLILPTIFIATCLFMLSLNKVAIRQGSS